MVLFPLIGYKDNAAMVAWTTTPWTLPSNLALRINRELVYIKVRDKLTGATYIVAESRYSQLPIKKLKADRASQSTTDKKSKTTSTSDGKTIDEEDFGQYELLEKYVPSSDGKTSDGNTSDGNTSDSKTDSLVGMKYQTLFDYFKECSETAFRVVADNFVTINSGTGIVHCAPTFGEDDYRVCTNSNIIRKLLCSFYHLFKYQEDYLWNQKKHLIMR